MRVFLRMFAIVSLPVFGVNAQADRESFAVMTAVLDSMYTNQGDRPQVVVVADSLYWRQGGVAYGGKLLVPYQSTIDPETIRDFERKTAKSVWFPREFTYRKLVRHTVEEWKELNAHALELEKTKSLRELRDMPFWVAFVEKHPRAWGITYLSSVGFNKDKSEALIFARHQCGGGCSSAETMFLKNIRGKWRLIERIDNGSGEGMGIGSLRYLGPGAHFISDLKKRNDSLRVAKADSIRRDRAPRQIQGTVVNHQTGLPIPFAQIFVRSHSEFGRDSLRRVVADSRGRYVIRDPALGTTMLELQCPGPRYRRGTTLDAPGLYVFPMTDTVIGLGPPNIEPCWSPRRTRPLMSGELSSSRYRESQSPSTLELGVYAAVIHDLNLAGSVIVAADTRPRCERHSYCEPLHVTRLERMEIADPSTLASFTALSSESVPLNPVRMQMLGLTLLSKGERTYLAHESKRGGMFGFEGDEREFWTALRSNHPGVTQIVSFTRAAFNTKADQAMVSIRIERAGDESLETVVLQRTSQNWRIVWRHLEDETPTSQ